MPNSKDFLKIAGTVIGVLMVFVGILAVGMGWTGLLVSLPLTTLGLVLLITSVYYLRQAEARSGAYRRYREQLEEEIVACERGEYRKILQTLPALLDLMTDLLEAGEAEKLSWEGRWELCAALGYLFLPEDVIPDDLLIGRGVKCKGYIDDAFLCSKILEDFALSGFEEMVRERWKGEEDIIKLLRRTREDSQRILEDENVDSDRIIQYVGLGERKW